MTHSENIVIHVFAILLRYFDISEFGFVMLLDIVYWYL